MQEDLLAATESVGAEVRRGVTVRNVETGAAPAVTIDVNGREETLRARLVVGADGRGSRVRDQLGLTPERDPERLVVAGLLLGDADVPDHTVHVFRMAGEGRGALFFPQPGKRTRAYYIYRKRGARLGLSGPAAVPRVLDACIAIGVPEGWLQRATAAGPLAEFEGADTWVSHPYCDGVALIGDAASSNDPAWGNGLSLTLRDIRALREAVLGTTNWVEAGAAYGQAHAAYFGNIRRVTRWLTDLMYEIGSEADAARARAFPLMATDRSRSLDYIAHGPETPSDEQARRRFFGEDAEPPAPPG